MLQTLSPYSYHKAVTNYVYFYFINNHLTKKYSKYDTHILMSILCVLCTHILHDEKFDKINKLYLSFMNNYYQPK